MSGGKGRVALYLQDKHPVRDGMNYVRYAEERGFEAVWQAESRLVREATIPLAAFAAVTERIKVGTGVINLWTRNVGVMAAPFGTLDDLAPGRVLLGIGAWWEPLASKVGVDRRKPLQAMREMVEVVRRLIRMERVTFPDEVGRVLTWPAGPEEIHKAMRLVPDEVVQMITASGTPDECRAKVREYVAAGCTCPILYPLGDDVPAMIDAFAGGQF